MPDCPSRSRVQSLNVRSRFHPGFHWSRLPHEARWLHLPIMSPAASSPGCHGYIPRWLKQPLTHADTEKPSSVNLSPSNVCRPLMSLIDPIPIDLPYISLMDHTLTDLSSFLGYSMMITNLM